jgi:N-acetylglucosaminyl-diphospho-decaprenol L-rhamnosyltransferase
MPDLSVVIVSYNTRGILRRCLLSLYDAAMNVPLQVIVVDNASTDGTIEMLQTRFPEVVIVANSMNTGFAAANNQGIELAEADALLLLNSDAFVTPEAIQAGLEALHRPGVGMAGVDLVNEDGSFQATSGRFPTLLSDVARSIGLDRLIPGQRQRLVEPATADWVQGACMFVRAAAIIDAGPLDADFFMYSEEVEWCWRIWRAGWEVWQLHGVAVVHLGGASSSTNDLSRRAALYRSRLALRRRIGGPVASFVLWTIMIAGLAGRIPARGVARLTLRRNVGIQTMSADAQLLWMLLQTNPLSRRASG